VTRTQLPPPLPPENRTVGQLVAEAIPPLRRALLARRWRSGSGLPCCSSRPRTSTGVDRIVVVLGAGPLVLAASYAGAIALVGRSTGGSTSASRSAPGFLAFLPVCVARLWVFGGIYRWLWPGSTLVGLAVPAALVERRGYADALRRGVQLARADYVHALGSLATLAITIFLTGLVIFFALREGSGQALRIAAVLALIVLAPLFVLGAAVLYVDQAARVESGPRARRKPDADVPSSFESDGAGRADVEGESRPPARGEQGR
jgi:hypothetical protein